MTLSGDVGLILYFG